MRHMNKGDTNKSAIVEHSCENELHISFEETAITVKIHNYFLQVTRETIDIYKSKNIFNRDDSYKLLGVSKHVLNKVKDHYKEIKYICVITKKLLCSKIFRFRIMFQFLK